MSDQLTEQEITALAVAGRPTEQAEFIGFVSYADAKTHFLYHVRPKRLASYEVDLLIAFQRKGGEEPFFRRRIHCTSATVLRRARQRGYRLESERKEVA